MKPHQLRQSGIVLAALVLLVNTATVRAMRQQATERPLRIALIGFANGSQPVNWKQRGKVEARLALALGHDKRVLLVDDSLTQAALSGLGYGGSLNLSTEEARRLGGAIGCDFFIIGKTDSFTRSEQAGEAHEETYIGVIIADGRTGQLVQFDFILKKAASRATAHPEATSELMARVKQYVDRMMEFRAARTETGAASREVAEEIPEADSAQAKGFKPPEFVARVKPDYTEEADRADVNATVEARVVFRASGEIGEVEIIRWAGFGLEDAAVRAIKQLRFKPATRNDQPISVRALVQYNFRRVTEKEGEKGRKGEGEKGRRGVGELFYTK